MTKREQERRERQVLKAVLLITEARVAEAKALKLVGKMGGLRATDRKRANRFDRESTARLWDLAGPEAFEQSVRRAIRLLDRNGKKVALGA